MDRTNCVNESFTGTNTAVVVLPRNKYREHIYFHSVSGTCQICIGGNTFSTNAISLDENVQWEPTKVFTETVWFKGDGAILSIISSSALHPIGDPPSGDWLTDNNGNYLTDNNGEF